MRRGYNSVAGASEASGGCPLLLCPLLTICSETSLEGGISPPLYNYVLGVSEVICERMEVIGSVIRAGKESR